jgi:hypothetical protein
MLTLRPRRLTTAATAVATHHGSHTHTTLVTATHDPHHAPTHAAHAHTEADAHRTCTPHTTHALPITHSTQCTYVNDDSPDTTDGKLPLIWLRDRTKSLHARTCITTNHHGCVDTAKPCMLLLRPRTLTTATTALATHHGSHTHCTLVTATHNRHHHHNNLPRTSGLDHKCSEHT